jgi:glutathione S-transferase
MTDPATKIYVASVALLALKMIVLALMTVARRSKAKQFTLAEDAKAFKGEAVTGDEESVQRVFRAHRNDIENNLLFFILGGLYLLTNPPVAYAQSYFYTYVIARYLHTAFFLGKLQPRRSLMFVVALLANLGLAVQLLIAAFS